MCNCNWTFLLSVYLVSICLFVLCLCRIGAWCSCAHLCVRVDVSAVSFPSLQYQVYALTEFCLYLDLMFQSNWCWYKQIITHLSSCWTMLYIWLVDYFIQGYRFIAIMRSQRILHILPKMRISHIFPHIMAFSKFWIFIYAFRIFIYA